MYGNEGIDYTQRVRQENVVALLNMETRMVSGDLGRRQVRVSILLGGCRDMENLA